MSPHSCDSVAAPRCARTVEAEVPLSTFLDFVLTAGPERLKLAAPPHPGAYDFHAPLVVALREAHEMGRLTDLEGRWRLEKDKRRARIYPVLSRAYVAAARQHRASFRRPASVSLQLGSLAVAVEPHAVWTLGGKGCDLHVLLHFNGEPASGQRIACALAAARLAGIKGAFVDLQLGTDMVLGSSRLTDDGEALAFFEAEALSFAAMRRGLPKAPPGRRLP